jgi:hypothetical protein
LFDQTGFGIGEYGVYTLFFVDGLRTAEVVEEQRERGDEDDEVDETVLEPAIFAHISSQSRRWHSVDGVLRGVAGEHATVRSPVIISLQFLAGQAQNVAKW